MTHGSFQPQAATLGLFLWSQTFLKNRCRKERELLLIWGPAPSPPGFFQGMGVYRPMRVKAGREAQLHAPFSSFDELTGLFLSAVASPQSRPPLHPLRSPYKPHDPAQVFFESDTTFLLLPPFTPRSVWSTGNRRNCSVVAERASALFEWQEPCEPRGSSTDL